jgi:hypothetical protein
VSSQGGGGLRSLAYLALIAAIVFLILYFTGGKGRGLDGSDDKTGSARPLVASFIDAGAKRCEIFIAAEGITVDGVKRSRDEVVAACQETAGADVIVAGDARRGDWKALEAALNAAKIEIFKREPSVAPSGSGALPRP